MSASPLHVIVLAAGEGKRMKSARPKVLLPLAGRPMLAHVIDTARALQPTAIHVVYGHRGEQVRAAFAGASDLSWIEQAEQHGTGHAVGLALPGVPDDVRVLVLYGDVPLIGAATLRPLVDAGAPLAVLAAELIDPTGYGRVVRDGLGHVPRDRRREGRDDRPARDPARQHRHHRRRRSAGCAAGSRSSATTTRSTSTT